MPNSELSEKMSEADVDTETYYLHFFTRLEKSKDQIAEDRDTQTPILTT